MSRVMRPDRGPVHVGDARGIEVVLVNERVVDDHRTVAPAGVPSPSAPTSPAASKVHSHVDADSEPEPEAAHNDAGRRPIPAWVRIPARPSPDPHGVVYRNIDHIGIGGHDFD